MEKCISQVYKGIISAAAVEGVCSGRGDSALADGICLFQAFSGTDRKDSHFVTDFIVRKVSRYDRELNGIVQ